MIVTHVSVRSHHQPVRPDIERVAVTHHVSHACDTAKVPVGSMHCPCTANGCCVRVSVIRCHRLLPLLSSGVFQFYGTAPRCPSQLSWRSARRACGSMATLHTIDTPAGRPTMDWLQHKLTRGNNLLEFAWMWCVIERSVTRRCIYCDWHLKNPPKPHPPDIRQHCITVQMLFKLRNSSVREA